MTWGLRYGSRTLPSGCSEVSIRYLRATTVRAPETRGRERERERERERIKAGALVSYKAPLHDKYPLECRTLYFAVNVALEQ